MCLSRSFLDKRMSSTKLISVLDYLRATDLTVDEELLITIRNCYRQVLKLKADVAIPEDPDEKAIAEVARQLNLAIDTDKSRECLIECVKYENIDDTKAVVSGILAEVKPLDEIIFDIGTRPHVPPTRLTSNVMQDSPHVTQHSASITDIDCLLNLKKRTDEVDQFIHSFLLQDTKALYQQVTT